MARLRLIVLAKRYRQTFQLGGREHPQGKAATLLLKSRLSGFEADIGPHRVRSFRSSSLLGRGVVDEDRQLLRRSAMTVRVRERKNTPWLDFISEAAFF